MSDTANEIGRLSDEDLIRRYVDGSFRWLERNGLNRWPGVPPSEMWAGKRDANGWGPWRPVPSTVDDADLDKLQAEHGLPYPRSYRAFLKYEHFVDLAAFGLDFERHLPGEWADELRDLYYRAFDRQRIIKAGLLPFGHETLADCRFGLLRCDEGRRAGFPCGDLGPRINPDRKGNRPPLFFGAKVIRVSTVLCGIEH